MTNHFLIACIVSLLAFTGSSAATYKSLPIVGIGKQHPYSYLDSTTMSLMKDAGIDIAMTTLDPGRKTRHPDRVEVPDTSDWQNFDLTLANARKMGMKLIISLWMSRSVTEERCNPQSEFWNGWYSRWRNLVCKYRDCPDVYGWELRDEPSSALFRVLAAAKDTIRRYDGHERPVYVNLYPHLNSASRLSGPAPKDLEVGNYSEYLSLFDRIFRPEIWSFDCYGIGRKGEDRFVRAEMFRNLEIYRRLSLRTGRSFWGYSLGMEVIFPNTKHPEKSGGYARPDETTIGLETRAALAFGAQGLVYWTMTQRPDALDKNGKPIEIYPTAPIDLEGKPTPILDAIKKVNRSIRDMEHVFAGAKALEVVFSSDLFPNGKTGIKTLEKKKGIGPLRNLDSEGNGIVISRLRNGEREYMVFVSPDLERNRKISAEFRHPVRELTGNSGTTGTKVWHGEISPGGWLIFEIL